jgi:hypothetical protein
MAAIGKREDPCGARRESFVALADTNIPTLSLLLHNEATIRSIAQLRA